MTDTCNKLGKMIASHPIYMKAKKSIRAKYLGGKLQSDSSVLRKHFCRASLVHSALTP